MKSLLLLVLACFPLASPLATEFISFTDLSVTLPTSQKPLFDKLTFTLNPNTKYALVGPNGCGKSTLVKQLIYHYNQKNSIPQPPPPPLLTSGSIFTPTISATTIGYISQSSVNSSPLSVYEECLTAIPGYLKHKHLSDLLENGDTSSETLDEFASLSATYTDPSSLVHSTLTGLSFKLAEFNQPCSSFSGGWQMRISLARLLLSQPDALILDEPSNHLDSSARQWLSDFVTKYPKCVLLVSHDMQLLNALLKPKTNCVLEINSLPSTGLSVYKACASYTAYLDEKTRRHAAAVAAYERNSAEAARLQEFVDKWGASATKASMAQSKAKAIQRMKKEGLLEPVAPLSLLGSEDSATNKVKFPKPPPGGDELASLSKCEISYTNASTPQLRNVDLQITAGSRMVIRGPNGAGKSTLLRALAASAGVSITGDRFTSPGCVVNFFTQDLAQELPGDITPVAHVASYVREYDVTISDTRIRAVLGALGLSTFAQTQKIGNLSGGEKGRVALASFVLKPANLLIMDEPSNHLDVDTISALADGLRAFEAGESKKRAAVVVISHDREFVERLQSTHVCMVQGGSVKVEQRALRESDWVFGGGGGEMVEAEVVVKSAGAKPVSSEERKKRLNAPKRVVRIENMVAGFEEELARLEVDMGEAGSDATAAMEVLKKKQQVERKVDKLMKEWEELEQLMAV